MFTSLELTNGSYPVTVVSTFFFFRLKSLKARVQEARMSSALFDTRQYTQDLETLFGKIWDRHEKGLPPDHIE